MTLTDADYAAMKRRLAADVLSVNVLHVRGDVDLNSLRPRNAIILGNSPGTAGQVVTSQGAGKSPKWGSGGGGGVTWPLAFSGDENFQPGGEANDILRLTNPGNGEDCGINIGNAGGTAAGQIALYAFSDTAASVSLNIASQGPAGDIVLNGIRNIFVEAGGKITNEGVTIIENSAPEFIWDGANAAPTSGDLADGDFALWLDQTPGATKLHVVGKDSGGTVRTATIALT